MRFREVGLPPLCHLPRGSIHQLQHCRHSSGSPTFREFSLLEVIPTMLIAMNPHGRLIISCRLGHQTALNDSAALGKSLEIQLSFTDADSARKETWC